MGILPDMTSAIAGVQLITIMPTAACSVMSILLPAPMAGVPKSPPWASCARLSPLAAILRLLPAIFRFIRRPVEPDQPARTTQRAG